VTPVALFANELGGGRGHIARLNAVASVARDLGYRPVLSLPKGPDTLRPPADWHFDALIEGPELPRLRNVPAQLNVGGLASNLARTGFVDKSRIASVVAEWHALLMTHRPHVVVGDFAPYARLACLDRIPFLMLGSGYTLPSKEGLRPFPMEQRKRDPSRVIRRILSQVNATLSTIGTSEIEDLGACLRGDRNVVACLPILDPTDGREAEEYFGPLESLPELYDSNGHSNRVYAYLHSVTQNDTVALGQLARHGLQIDLFCDGEVHEIGRIARHLETPLAPRQIVEKYSLTYHRAGLGLATQCLLAGLPQLLNPRHLEASFTAARLENEGFGIDLSNGDRAETLGAFGSLLDFPLIDTQRIESFRSWMVSKDWHHAISKLLRDLA